MHREPFERGQQEDLPLRSGECLEPRLDREVAGLCLAFLFMSAGARPHIVEQAEQRAAYVLALGDPLRLLQKGFQTDPDIGISGLLRAQKSARIAPQIG